MPKVATAKGAPATRWEANCLFCGDSIRDEGVAFLDHIGAKASCHNAYEAWVDNLDLDRPGG